MTIWTPPAANADLSISGLRLWVHGLEFPDSDDYWDVNWLRVTAEYRAGESRVRAHGPFVHLGEVLALLEGCEALHRTLEGSAALSCIEPTLRVDLKGDGLGHVGCVVSLTPDHLTEEHCFRSEIDQTFLPDIVQACRRILERWPIRGSR